MTGLSMRSIPKAVMRKWETNFLALELWGAVVVAGALGVWLLSPLDGAAAMESLLEGNRSGIYQTFVQVFGSLFGFAVTMSSIMVGLCSSDRMKVVRESNHYGDLWKICWGTVRSSAFVAVAALFCLVGDREQTPRVYFSVALFFGLCWFGVRMMRAIWALRKVVTLVGGSRQR